MHKAVTAVFILVTTFAFCGSAASAAEVRLAEDGKPLAVIVLPGAPGDAEAFAASELQSYLEKITGAMLPVKPESELGGDEAFISVGRTRLSADARERLAGELPDSFIVEGVGNGILLAGAGGSGRSPGTLFAVYDFLERDLGCRWLGPNELWEEIPELATLSVAPAHRLERPAFRFRADGAFRASHNMWALKNKGNVGESSRWPFDWFWDRGGDDVLPCDLSAWLAPHTGPRALLPVSGRAVDPQLRERMLSRHPDWFALQRDGLRSSSWFCHDSPEVVDLMADRLSQMFRERPHKELLRLGDGDGLGRGRCRCEGCLALDEAGGIYETRRGICTHRWLNYINRVAALLAESDPGKFLGQGAYASKQEPPDPRDICAAENVITLYTAWADCRLHGWEHVVSGVADPEKTDGHERSRRWIERWRRASPAGLIMTEYLSRNSMDFITGAQPRRFIRDLRYLRDKGFIGYRSFVGVNSWGLYGINRYAAIKAMWNPDLDEEELVRDYCDHAFREASEHMQAFVNVIEEAMKRAGCGNSRSVSWTVVPSALEEARNHLDSAHKSAVGNSVVEQRLISWEAHFGYIELAGPIWTRLVGQHDPEKLRAAMAEAEAALENQAMRIEKYREHPDYDSIRRGGSRLRSSISRDGIYGLRLTALDARRKSGDQDGD